MIIEDMRIREIIRYYPSTKSVLKYYNLLAEGCG
jgi:hypothetical protein